MSEQERLNRAERIRRMREGAREETDDEGDDEGDADGSDAGSETGARSDGTAGSGGTRAPLPDEERLEAALAEADETGDATAGTPDATPETGAATGAGAEPAPADAGETETGEETTRVLEFELDGEYYCLDIEYIEEIVEQEAITRVPNTPEFVEGVVDLRGQITTILNPKVVIGKENAAASDLVVVFDAEAFEDQGNVGWVVDDVRQVSLVAESEVNDPPVEEGYVSGVIDRESDEEFVVWVTPDLAFEDA